MSKRYDYGSENEDRRAVAIYMQGWRAGAAFRVLSPIESADATFTEGWKDGREACDYAYRRACAIQGIEPSYITVNEG